VAGPRGPGEKKNSLLLARWHCRRLSAVVIQSSKPRLRHYPPTLLANNITGTFVWSCGRIQLLTFALFKPLCTLPFAHSRLPCRAPFRVFSVKCSDENVSRHRLNESRSCLRTSPIDVSILINFHSSYPVRSLNQEKQ